MEQPNTTSKATSEPTQNAEFIKRRSQKNWIVLGLIMGGVALVWSVTMLKMQQGQSMAHPIGVDSSMTKSDTTPPPQLAKKGDKHAQ